MWFPFSPVIQQLWNTLLCETVCVCDLNSNHLSWLLTQNSTHGKLPKPNETSDRVHDRFDFTPGPGVGFVLATNRAEALAFPSSAGLFIPTIGGCVTTQLLMPKSEVQRMGCPVLNLWLTCVMIWNKQKPTWRTLVFVCVYMLHNIIYNIGNVLFLHSHSLKSAFLTVSRCLDRFLGATCSPKLLVLTSQTLVFSTWTQFSVFKHVNEGWRQQKYRMPFKRWDGVNHTVEIYCIAMFHILWGLTQKIPPKKSYKYANGLDQMESDLEKAGWGREQCLGVKLYWKWYKTFGFGIECSVIFGCELWQSVIWTDFRPHLVFYLIAINMTVFFEIRIIFHKAI